MKLPILIVFAVLMGCGKAVWIAGGECPHRTFVEKHLCNDGRCYDAWTQASRKTAERNSHVDAAGKNDLWCLKDSNDPGKGYQACPKNTVLIG